MVRWYGDSSHEISELSSSDCCSIQRFNSARKCNSVASVATCEVRCSSRRSQCGLVSLLSFEPDRNADQTTTSGNKQKPQNSAAHFMLPRDRPTESFETAAMSPQAPDDCGSLDLSRPAGPRRRQWSVRPHRIRQLPTWPRPRRPGRTIGSSAALTDEPKARNCSRLKTFSHPRFGGDRSLMPAAKWKGAGV